MVNIFACLHVYVYINENTYAMVYTYTHMHVTGRPRRKTGIESHDSHNVRISYGLG